MSMIQITSARGEIEASIIKGYLESAGLKVSIATSNNNAPSRYNPRGPDVPFGVYVEEDKAEEAIQILAERKTDIQPEQS